MIGVICAAIILPPFTIPISAPCLLSPASAAPLQTIAINNHTLHMLHNAQCIVKTSLLIHRSMQSADTAVHLCAFRWRFLLQAPSLLQGTSISAPCLLAPFLTACCPATAAHASCCPATTAQNSMRTLTWRWKLGELKRQWLVLNLQGRPKIFTQLQSLRLQSCCALFSASANLKVIQDEAEEQVVLELPSLIIFPLLC